MFCCHESAALEHRYRVCPKCKGWVNAFWKCINSSCAGQPSHEETGEYSVMELLHDEQRAPIHPTREPAYLYATKEQAEYDLQICYPDQLRNQRLGDEATVHVVEVPQWHRIVLMAWFEREMGEMDRRHPHKAQRIYDRYQGIIDTYNIRKESAR